MTAWHQPWTPAAGTLCRQAATPTVNNERAFICITSGAVGATEPVWVVTKGAKTTDGSAVWQECSGQPATNGDLTNTPSWAQQFAFSTTVTIGLIITDAAQDYYFIVSTAGTMGGSEPTWTKTAGVTTTDSGVTWTCIGTVGSFSAWNAPHARLKNAITAPWPGFAGATIYLGDDHIETQSTAMSFSSGSSSEAGPFNIICIDHTVSLPPTSSNLKTTASIAATGASSVTVTCNSYWYGVIVNFGFIITISADSRFDSCSLLRSGSSSTSGTALTISCPGQVEFNHVKVQFGNIADSIAISSSRLYWHNTASAISGATLPTTLFKPNLKGALAVVEGVDLSALGSSNTLVGNIASSYTVFQNCLFGSSVPVAATPAVWGEIVDVVNSDSAATDYQIQRYTYAGTLVPSTTIIRTGGASNGTTAISYMITTTANALWVYPFQCPPVAIWNTEIAVNATVTLHGIWNSASLPNNDQIWIDVEYMGSSGSPMASLGSGTKANIVATGSALTADSTSTWNSLATAWIASTAYTTASPAISVSSSTLVFWCISNGTSNGTLPSGYATATDGQTVTDGSATFRAGTRFLLQTVLSSPQPQLVGPLFATIKAALPSSVFWVDPLIVLS